MHLCFHMGTSTFNFKHGPTYCTCYATNLSLKECNFEQIDDIKSIVGIIFFRGDKRKEKRWIFLFGWFWVSVNTWGKN